MIITICGSIKFLDEMEKVKQQLMQLGFTQIYTPTRFKVPIPKTGIPEEDAQHKISLNLIQEHYEKILKSDAILVLNYSKNGINNYIGGNTLMEIGFAFVNKKKIFLLNPIPELAYSAEIISMQPIILHGDLTLLTC